MSHVRPLILAGVTQPRIIQHIGRGAFGTVYEITSLGNSSTDTTMDVDGQYDTQKPVSDHATSSPSMVYKKFGTTCNFSDRLPLIRFLDHAKTAYRDTTSQRSYSDDDDEDDSDFDSSTDTDDTDAYENNKHSYSVQSADAMSFMPISPKDHDDDDGDDETYNDRSVEDDRPKLQRALSAGTMTMTTTASHAILHKSGTHPHMDNIRANTKALRHFSRSSHGAAFYDFYAAVFHKANTVHVPRVDDFVKLYDGPSDVHTATTAYARYNFCVVGPTSSGNTGHVSFGDETHSLLRECVESSIGCNSVISTTYNTSPHALRPACLTPQNLVSGLHTFLSHATRQTLETLTPMHDLPSERFVNRRDAMREISTYEMLNRGLDIALHLRHDDGDDTRWITASPGSNTSCDATSSQWAYHLPSHGIDLDPWTWSVRGILLKKGTQNLDDAQTPSRREFDHKPLSPLTTTTITSTAAPVTMNTDADSRMIVNSANLQTTPDGNAHPTSLPLTNNTLVSQLLAGISDMHCRGIVHRDIKPLNIITSYDMHRNIFAHISDFGGARRVWMSTAIDLNDMTRSEPHHDTTLHDKPVVPCADSMAEKHDTASTNINHDMDVSSSHDNDMTKPLPPTMRATKSSVDADSEDGGTWPKCTVRDFSYRHCFTTAFKPIEYTLRQTNTRNDHLADSWSLGVMLAGLEQKRWCLFGEHTPWTLILDAMNFGTSSWSQWPAMRQLVERAESRQKELTLLEYAILYSPMLWCSECIARRCERTNYGAYESNTMTLPPGWTNVDESSFYAAGNRIAKQVRKTRRDRNTRAIHDETLVFCPQNIPSASSHITSPTTPSDTSNVRKNKPSRSSSSMSSSISSKSSSSSSKKRHGSIISIQDAVDSCTFPTITTDDAVFRKRMLNFGRHAWQVMDPAIDKHLVARFRLRCHQCQPTLQKTRHYEFYSWRMALLEETATMVQNIIHQACRRQKRRVSTASTLPLGPSLSQPSNAAVPPPPLLPRTILDSNAGATSLRPVILLVHIDDGMADLAEHGGDHVPLAREFFTQQWQCLSGMEFAAASSKNEMFLLHANALGWLAERCPRSPLSLLVSKSTGDAHMRPPLAPKNPFSAPPTCSEETMPPTATSKRIKKLVDAIPSTLYISNPGHTSSTHLFSARAPSSSATSLSQSPSHAQPAKPRMYRNIVPQSVRTMSNENRVCQNIPVPSSVTRPAASTATLPDLEFLYFEHNLFSARTSPCARNVVEDNAVHWEYLLRALGPVDDATPFTCRILSSPLASPSYDKNIYYRPDTMVETTRWDAETNLCNARNAPLRDARTLLAIRIAPPTASESIPSQKSSSSSSTSTSSSSSSMFTSSQTLSSSDHGPTNTPAGSVDFDLVMRAVRSCLGLPANVTPQEVHPPPVMSDILSTPHHDVWFQRWWQYAVQCASDTRTTTAYHDGTTNPIQNSYRRIMHHANHIIRPLLELRTQRRILPVQSLWRDTFLRPSPLVDPYCRQFQNVWQSARIYGVYRYWSVDSRNYMLMDDLTLKLTSRYNLQPLPTSSQDDTASKIQNMGWSTGLYKRASALFTNDLVHDHVHARNARYQCYRTLHTDLWSDFWKFVLDAIPITEDDNALNASILDPVIHTASSLLCHVLDATITEPVDETTEECSEYQMVCTEILDDSSHIALCLDRENELSVDEGAPTSTRPLQLSDESHVIAMALRMSHMVKSWFVSVASTINVSLDTWHRESHGSPTANLDRGRLPILQQETIFATCALFDQALQTRPLYACSAQYQDALDSGACAHAPDIAAFFATFFEPCAEESASTSTSLRMYEACVAEYVRNALLTLNLVEEMIHLIVSCAHLCGLLTDTMGAHPSRIVSPMMILYHRHFMAANVKRAQLHACVMDALLGSATDFDALLQENVDNMPWLHTYVSDYDTYSTEDTTTYNAAYIAMFQQPWCVQLGPGLFYAPHPEQALYMVEHAMARDPRVHIGSTIDTCATSSSTQTDVTRGRIAYWAPPWVRHNAGDNTITMADLESAYAITSKIPSPIDLETLRSIYQTRDWLRIPPGLRIILQTWYNAPQYHIAPFAEDRDGVSDTLYHKPDTQHTNITTPLPEHAGRNVCSIMQPMVQRVPRGSAKRQHPQAHHNGEYHTVTSVDFLATQHIVVALSTKYIPSRRRTIRGLNPPPDASAHDHDTQELESGTEMSSYDSDTSADDGLYPHCTKEQLCAPRSSQTTAAHARVSIATRRIERSTRFNIHTPLLAGTLYRLLSPRTFIRAAWDSEEHTTRTLKHLDFAAISPRSASGDHTKEHKRDPTGNLLRHTHVGTFLTPDEHALIAQESHASMHTLAQKTHQAIQAWLWQNLTWHNGMEAIADLQAKRVAAHANPMDVLRFDRVEKLVHALGTAYGHGNIYCGDAHPQTPPTFLSAKLLLDRQYELRTMHAYRMRQCSSRIGYIADVCPNTGDTFLWTPSTILLHTRMQGEILTTSQAQIPHATLSSWTMDAGVRRALQLMEDTGIKFDMSKRGVVHTTATLDPRTTLGALDMFDRMLHTAVASLPDMTMHYDRHVIWGLVWCLRIALDTTDPLQLQTERGRTMKASKTRSKKMSSVHDNGTTTNDDESAPWGFDRGQQCHADAHHKKVSSIRVRASWFDGRTCVLAPRAFEIMTQRNHSHTLSMSALFHKRMVQHAVVKLSVPWNHEHVPSSSLRPSSTSTTAPSHPMHTSLTMSQLPTCIEFMMQVACIPSLCEPNAHGMWVRQSVYNTVKAQWCTESDVQMVHFWMRRFAYMLLVDLQCSTHRMDYALLTHDEGIIV